MSGHQQSMRNTIKLYASPPHPCSYLPGRQATTLFVDPFFPMTQAAYTYLSQLGLRRSGNHVYKPACEGCHACVPVRVPVASFRPNRSQRRTWRVNQDLSVRTCTEVATDEQFPLYAKYLATRHSDGDMHPPDREQFQSFLSSGWSDSVAYEFRADGRLVAVAVTDRLQDGLSAIYTFFDPAEAARGLGTYAVLWQIAEAERLRLPYLYLGYWIQACRKMSYKQRFHPLEGFVDGHWVVLRKALSATADDARVDPTQPTASLV